MNDFPKDDMSNIFRTGVITNQKFIDRELALTEDGSKTIPFVCFQMESRFPIGLGEFHTEKTNVMLVGEDPVSAWRQYNPAPGDFVSLHYSIAYVKDGLLCVRVTRSSDLVITPLTQHQSQSAPKVQTCAAIDVFADILAKKKKGE